MFTEEEKKQIMDSKETGLKLSEELRNKLLMSIKNGEPSIFKNDGDELCCDTGEPGDYRYVWTTFSNCNAVGGRAADNSKCGH